MSDGVVLPADQMQAIFQTLFGKEIESYRTSFNLTQLTEKGFIERSRTGGNITFYGEFLGDSDADEYHIEMVTKPLRAGQPVNPLPVRARWENLYRLQAEPVLTYHDMR